MMTSAISGYFVMVGFYVLLKYTMPKRSLLIDIGFIVAVFVTMLALNVETQKSICGQVDPGTIAATLAPWLMLAAIMGTLRFFPGWKKPFSNTFGYLVMTFADAGGILRKVLEKGAHWTTNTRLKSMLEESPNALLYEMQYKPEEEFQETIDKLSKDESIGLITGAQVEIGNLVNVLLLKDLIGEMVWYMLVGVVAISVSYNIVVDCKVKNFQTKL